MNSFGRIFRVHIFGESHGECVGLTIDGCPAGLPLSVEDFTADIERRKPGAKGTTPRREDDIPQIKLVYLTAKLQEHPLPSYLKIITPAVPIMINCVPYPGRAMPIL